MQLLIHILQPYAVRYILPRYTLYSKCSAAVYSTGCAGVPPEHVQAAGVFDGTLESLGRLCCLSRGGT